MTMAASLLEAAHLTYAQIDILVAVSSAHLTAQYQAFIDAMQPMFPDEDYTQHPVGNWLVIMQALITDYSGTANKTIYLIDPLATAMYRILVLAKGLESVPKWVTPAKRVAIIAAWNATIGT